MAYINYLRRTSSRLLSVQGCQQQQQSLVRSARAATVSSVSTSSSELSSIHRPIGLRTIASASIRPRTSASSSALRESFEESSSFHDGTATRGKHSSTQIKRLFKQNPAKRRIALKQQLQQTDAIEDIDVIPESTIPPLVSDPSILSNGWNVPVSVDSSDNEIPFRVSRTKNKPNNAVGFLPVYSEFRKDGARVTTRIKKVSGDQGLFLNELRAALQIPIPKNPREDSIRVRTGGTIEIKGNRVLEVKTWLAGLGF